MITRVKADPNGDALAKAQWLIVQHSAREVHWRWGWLKIRNLRQYRQWRHDKMFYGLQASGMPMNEIFAVLKQRSPLLRHKAKRCADA